MSSIRKALVPWQHQTGSWPAPFSGPGLFHPGSLVGSTVFSFLVEADREGMEKGGAGWQVHVLENAQRGLTPLRKDCSGEQDDGGGAQCCWEM